MNNLKNMVVGFVFNKALDQVVLITKEKPDWQKGKRNGIGGKIEEGETSLEAMTREFEEEAGAIIKNWVHFAEMAIVPPVKEDEDTTPGVFIDVFYTVQDAIVYTKTIEEVKWYSLDILDKTKYPDIQILPNLRWLIPMALDHIQNPNTFEKARIIYRE